MTTPNQRILIQSPAPNLEASIGFYHKLNFVQTYQKDLVHIFSDAAIDIMVNGASSTRLSYVVFTKEIDGLKQRLPETAKLFNHDTGLVTTDPNGVRVYIYPFESNPTLDKSGIREKNVCGNNFGTGIETGRFDDSIQFWHALGYSTNNEITDKTQYATLVQDDCPAITLFAPGICPHAFYNPSLTYFNGKEGNPKVISALLKLGISPVEEITIFNNTGEVDNIIISDPGGLHAFIFNDG